MIRMNQLVYVNQEKETFVGVLCQSTLVVGHPQNALQAVTIVMQMHFI
jgi:hypothetical protein